VNHLIDMVREQRAKIVAPADEIIAKAESEARDLTADEFEVVKRSADEAKAIDERIAELTDLAERNALAAKPLPKVGGVVVRAEAQTYGKGAPNSHVRDTVLAVTRNDPQAWERLRRHAAEVAVETRDISRTDGAGGEFVPPLWLVDMFGDFPRPGRVVANLCTQLALPPGTDSINLPRITTGPQVAIQTADNAAVQETDAVTATVTAPVVTIAGQQDLSIQLVEQSPLAGGMDQLIYGQLLADYERVLGAQILNGSGGSGQVRGILNTVGINAVTFTNASPTVPLLYVPLAQAVNGVETNSFLPANAIVMHPRRWNWMTSALDSQNRPLVVPVAHGPFNAIGADQVGSAGQGFRGSVLGVGTYSDATMPTTVATNQDPIVVGDFRQAYLMEGAVRTRALPDVGSGTLTVRFQLYRYVAFTAGARPTAFSAITGTGQAAPSGF
jgi:HK97 family phage major capsid protein